MIIYGDTIYAIKPLISVFQYNQLGYREMYCTEFVHSFDEQTF